MTCIGLHLVSAFLHAYITQDAQSLVVQLYPECTSGNSATLIRYKDIFYAQINLRI